MSTAPLAIRDPRSLREPGAERWQDPDWQKLWLSVQGQSWSSLALVPASAGAPADFTLTIAVTLARIGILHLGVPIQVADATRIPLIHLAQFLDELARLKEDKERVLVALSSISDNPTTVPLAQATDTAVLCVLLEEMSSSEAKTTIDRVGAPHFLGSAVFHPPTIATPARPKK